MSASSVTTSPAATADSKAGLATFTGVAILDSPVFGSKDTISVV